MLFIVSHHDGQNIGFLRDKFCLLQSQPKFVLKLFLFLEKFQAKISDKIALMQKGCNHIPFATFVTEFSFSLVADSNQAFYQTKKKICLRKLSWIFSIKFVT